MCFLVFGEFLFNASRIQLVALLGWCVLEQPARVERTRTLVVSLLMLSVLRSETFCTAIRVRVAEPPRHHEYDRDEK